MYSGNLNEDTIKKQCEKNGFSYRYFGSTAIIMTGVDEWKLTTEKIHKDGAVALIKVHHLNTAGNSSGKMKFHKQRYAGSINIIFERIIVSHQAYDNVYNKAFIVKDLLTV